MEDAKQLASRLREVLLDGTWIAQTNYQDQLSNVALKQAMAKHESLNTILALCYHINYYVEGILNVFNGGSLEIKDKYSFDHPIITTEDEWKNMVLNFANNSRKFVEQVEAMSSAELDATFVKEEYGTYRRNIEGVIEHSYYHLGQLSLIRKLTKQPT